VQPPKKSADPYKRQATRYAGITYRVKADGSRTYYVRHGNSQVRVEGGEREARELQGKMRQHPYSFVAPSTVRFEDLAEQWFGSKRKLRTWTRTCYRDALDRIILPRFRGRRLSSITPQHVAELISELEKRGLSSSTINNYLLPLNGTLGMAVSRGLIAQNPYALLTKDGRPARKVVREHDHVWSDKEIDALIRSAEYRAKQPESRYDYAPLIRFAVKTGLRLGEILGLQWQDVNFKRRELGVRRQWTRTGEFAEPKTKAALRRVPLSDDVVTFLRDLQMVSRRC
jgi:integrase